MRLPSLEATVSVSTPPPGALPSEEPLAPPAVGAVRRLVGLDGLRAVLCLMVFGLHANVGALRAAWLTVDAFFVLSGFLITSLLLKEWGKTGRIEVLRFVKSRTLRLFPILLLAIAGTAVLYAVLPPRIPGERPLLHSAITSLTYTQNIFVGRHPTVHDPLLHTWSLAQEEQFYALWPLVLGLLLVRSRAVAIRVVLALAAASALLLLLTSRGPAPASYFWPWTRSSGLAFGAALSLLLSSEGAKDRVTAVLSRAGTGAVAGLAAAAPFVLLPHLGLGTAGVLFVGVTSVTLTSGLLIGHLASTSEGPANRLLRLPPLVHLGRWSYAFYLVHLPLLVVLSARMSHWHAFWLAFALSVLLAGALHYTVERPLDRLRHRLFPIV
jgi:peptidoglycan/LPS O-acetylase OafA/YrhL